MLITYKAFAQADNVRSEIPSEAIYMHINTSFLLAGETLLYTVYCIDNNSRKLSNLSKIGYVEIINQEHIPVFKQKIKLNNGIGYSDFFIPSTLPSGQYKIIGYTQLMRNTSSYFSNDLFIVNPFRKDQSQVTDTISANALQQNQSINEFVDVKESSILSLEVQGSAFKTREKVSLKLASLLNNASYGQYSLSVKKVYPIITPQRSASNAFDAAIKTFGTATRTNRLYIPEFRGELIHGKVIDKQTNEPVSDLKVALSIAEREPIFRITSTNADGSFYFNIQKDYENSSAIVQVVGDQSDDLEIIIPEKRQIDYEQFQFDQKYVIQKDQEELLLKKSINNQIENSYKEVKQDSIQENAQKSPFYGSNATDYYLDDYKRFSTMRQTFVEVIENAWIAREDGKNILKIKRTLNSLDFELPTLVLVDGVLVKNHENIISMDPTEIDKISVIRDQYIYGPHIFEGIIAIQTIDGNYKGLSTQKTIELFKPTQRKTYFFTNYSNVNEGKRIPDFRDQLLWIPQLTLDQKELILDFYTSDEKGTYEVNLEGFTVNGDPVSIKKFMTVE